MNKKGIELAASLIVVLIASLLIFGLAGGITYKLFCASGEKIEQIDAATQAQIERKLDSGAAVQIPDSTKTAESNAGFCGKSSASGAVFRIGIRNDLPDGPEGGLFTFDCDSKLQKSDGVVEPTNLCASVQGLEPVTIKATQKKTETILINVMPDTAPGKHVITITVLRGNNDFYGAANIYLTVE